MNTVKVSKNHWIVKFLTLKPYENLLFGKLQYLKHSWLDFDTGPFPQDTCGLRKLLIQHLLYALFMILLWIVLFSGSIITLVSALILVPFNIFFNFLPIYNWLIIWGTVFDISVIFVSFIFGVVTLSEYIFPKFKKKLLDKKEKAVISKLFLSLKEKFCSKIEYTD